MKEYYEIDNDKVIAYDTNYGQERYKYQDNIEEIFKTENIIEGLRNELNEIKNLEQELIKDKNKSIKTIIVSIKYFLIILFVILGLGVFPSILGSFTGIYLLLAKISIIVFGGLDILVMAGVTITSIISILKSKKFLDSSEIEELFVDNYIKYFEEELEKLKKDNKKTSINLKNGKIKTKIDYEELLEEYKSLAKLVFLIKYNEKRYESYYNNGTLKEHIDKEFNDDITSDIVKDYFDAKKYTLQNKDIID